MPSTLLLRFIIAVIGLVCIASPIAAADQSRPNILIAIADDHSYPYTGIYGDQAVHTPAFDRVARNGVLFHNAFAASPGCSPSRAALLTGRHTWELEQAGTHASSFPAKFQVYPDLLENAGYRIGYCGKGWGPGSFTASGRTRNPAGNAITGHKKQAPEGINSTNYAACFEDFLSQQKGEEPFYFWYGCHEPHRRYEDGAGLKQGKKPEDANVPSFLPNNKLMQSDILDYCREIDWFDQHLAQMLELLEQKGELENTLVIITADNGMPFPRAKANCYEYGIHVPLAISWPAGIPGNRQANDLIGFVDIAPTILEAAGIEVPENISGKSFWSDLTSNKSGVMDESRQYVFSARERHSSSRHNNVTYPIRCVRSEHYLYIRNFRPDRWPAGHPAGFKGDPFGYYDIDGAPSKTFLIEHKNDPEYKKYFDLSVAKRPAEELFDIKSDPGNLHNLANDPAFTQVKAQLNQTLEQTLRDTGDPRILNGGDIYESYFRYSRVREFPGPGEE